MPGLVVHGIEWITQSECAERLGVPEEDIRGLVIVGALRYMNGPDFRAMVWESDVQRVLANRAAFMLRSDDKTVQHWE